MHEDSPIRIRFAAPDDAPYVLAVYAPYVTDTAITFECSVPSSQDYAVMIANLSGVYPFLLAECEGRVVGFAYASRYRPREAFAPCVSTSIYIVPGAQRRRLGRSLYYCLLRLLKAQGYGVAYAAITIPNPASAALHASLGFTPVGVFPKAGYKLGRWHDMMWLQKELVERSGPPAQPGPVHGLCPEFVKARFEEAEKRIRLSSESVDSLE